MKRRHHPRDRPMTDWETALILFGVLLICLGMAVVYILNA